MKTSSPVVYLKRDCKLLSPDRWASTLSSVCWKSGDIVYEATEVKEDNLKTSLFHYNNKLVGSVAGR